MGGQRRGGGGKGDHKQLEVTGDRTFSIGYEEEGNFLEIVL